MSESNLPPPTCKTCVYFQDHKGDLQYPPFSGECRRAHPIANDGDGFCTVLETDWCGEHSEFLQYLAKLVTIQAMEMACDKLK